MLCTELCGAVIIFVRCILASEERRGVPLCETLSKVIMQD